MTKSGSTLSRKVIHDGRVGEFGIEEVELPSGRRTTLEVLHHPGAAAAVIFRNDETIVLLRQYRHAVGWLWEICAGKLDPGENAAECIGREIEEETGLRAANIQELGVMVPAPAYSDEKIWLFVATDVTDGKLEHGSDEEIELHDVRFDEALAMIERGEIVDAKTIAGLHLAARRRSRGA